MVGKNVRLTSQEDFTFIAKSESNTDILALSWNIATEPKLYRTLAPNPYSPDSQQIILERFPNVAFTDVIRAIVLAEPSAAYDRNFCELTDIQQKNELQKQKIESLDTHEILTNYSRKYAGKLERLTKESLYNRLSRVAFKFSDLSTIEEKYSQNQRQYFRLLIIDLIENRTHKPIKRKFIRPLMYELLASLVLLSFSYIIYNIDAHHAPQQKYNPKVNSQVLAFTAKKDTQEPKRLVIPSLNIDTSIEHVGLTPEGEMDVPSNTVNVGWYKLGPVPGVSGSAVISGHFDGREGKSGVFNNLDKLRPGDKIYIVNERSETTIFEVKESRTYDPGYADEVFLSNDNEIHLNLITCDGAWDRDKKSYSHRLVVFADIMQ